MLTSRNRCPWHVASPETTLGVSMERRTHGLSQGFGGKEKGRGLLPAPPGSLFQAELEIDVRAVVHSATRCRGAVHATRPDPSLLHAEARQDRMSYRVIARGERESVRSAHEAFRLQVEDVTTCSRKRDSGVVLNVFNLL